MEVHRLSDRLVILIPSIRAEGTALGGRTAGIDDGFIRLLALVRVEANKILNADLIRILERLGFHPSDKNLLPEYQVELQLRSKALP
ncbi:MAG: hypothetical protein RJB38_830 [Pseudomonadota bacterium]|jgi:hypothetical protein